MIRFLLVSIFLLTPFALSAQAIPDLQNPIALQVVPQNPAPGEVVQISAQNISNRDGVFYTWRINGTLVQEGVGERTLVFNAGSVGEASVVSLVVEDNGEVVGEVSQTIVPSSVDIVWEADSYTPPFYVGRPLPTGDSTITLTAVSNIIVDGARISPAALTYEWYVGQVSRPTQAGFGLSTITTSPPLFDSTFTVRLVVRTQSGGVVGGATTTIVPQAPEILIYEKHPLLGPLFNQAIDDSFSFSGEELTLELFPLFVKSTITSSYSWSVDGDVIDTGETPRELTLRRTGEGSGELFIGTVLNGAGSLYERAERTIKLIL